MKATLEGYYVTCDVVPGTDREVGDVFTKGPGDAGFPYVGRSDLDAATLDHLTIVGPLATAVEAESARAALDDLCPGHEHHVEAVFSEEDPDGIDPYVCDACERDDCEECGDVECEHDHRPFTDWPERDAEAAMEDRRPR